MKKRYNLKRTVSVALRPDLVAKLDKMAEREYTSRSQLIEKILRMYMLMEDKYGTEAEQGADRV